MKSFKEYIESKPLYYKEIDHNRVKIAYEMLKPHLNRPKKIIHIVGQMVKVAQGELWNLLKREWL